MMDEEHGKPADFVQPSSDKNNYSWGRIGDHNIVVASLPDGMYGTTNAAVTASQMLSSFRNIRVGLMVGIGAAIARPSQARDIRLGDVVVSLPQGPTGGVVQYDLVKSRVSVEKGHPTHTLQRVGFLNSPPEALLKALTSLRAQVERKGSKIPRFVKDMQARNPAMAKTKPGQPGYVYQGQENDRLFEASYIHTHKTGCNDCDPAKVILREKRDDPEEPEVHYGVIASGNELVKDAAQRDRILEMVGEECICLEMEAAGLMNSFPCLVIRGICDYADSHKNDAWQKYAAATAAAYAKEFLACVNSESLARTPKASEVLRQISKDTDEIRTNLKLVGEKIEEMKLDEHQKKIRDWLSAPDHSTNYTNALEKRHEGTGLWFIRSEAFKTWKNQPNSFLWLHGIAGCGKTILSSTIINHLQSDVEPDRPLLYFYFDFNESNKQNLENMLRSLTSQLYQAQPEARSLLDELWRSHGNVRYSSELDRWQNRPDVQNEIESDLVEKADGMFRWVACQIDALRNCYDYPRLQRALQNLPRTLDDTYTRILESIPKDHIGQTMTVLNLLVWSDYTFSTIEIVDAIAVNLDEDPGFNPKHRMPVPREVLRLCSSLVVVSKDIHYLGGYKENKSTDVVRLAHFSVKEYLISDHVSKACGSLLSESVARAYLARLCLTYVIAVGRLASLGGRCDGVLSRSLSGFPFIYYSSQHWMDHAQGIEDRDESLWKLIMRFLLEEPDALWLATEYAPIYWEEEFGITHSWTRPIPYASACGLTQVVGHLIDTGAGFADADAIAKHDCLGDALELASRKAHDTIVQLLLERGANVNAKDGAALRIAISCGYDTTVKLLLDRGAHFNVRDGVALQKAAGCGNETTVRLLLDNGADIDARNEYGETALFRASRLGYDTTVQLLLDRGADIDARNEYGETALFWASHSGYDTTVQLLLDRGADIDARNEDGGTALFRASWSGNDEVVQLLLDRGADIDARNEDGETALFWASRPGNDEVVQLLLDRGADIDARNEDGETALFRASHSGYDTTVQLLLDRGADLHAQDHAALCSAIRQGCYTIVELLLDRGADVNAGDGAALQEATEGEFEDVGIPKLLLDRGANVNAQDGIALRSAVDLGRNTMAKLLLDRGADVNARNGAALRSAAKRGHYSIADLLLDHGADVNAEDEDGLTALIIALGTKTLDESDAPGSRYSLWEDETTRIEKTILVMLPYLTLELAAQEDRKRRNTLQYAALYGSEATVQSSTLGCV
ncbi:purine and uridine phosphorylase, partial [Aureobasidium melanogenum]